MKKKLFALASAGLLLLGTHSASAHSSNNGSSDSESITNIHNWYTTVMGSVGWQSDSKFGEFEGEKFGSKIEYKTAYDVSVAIGYIMNQWRMETEWYFQRAEIKDGSVTDTADNSIGEADIPGHFAQHAWMLNLLYVMALNDAWSLYFGAGLGMAWQHLEASQTLTNNAKTFIGTQDSVHAFAWQILAGISWDMTEHIAIILGYRFFATNKVVKANLGATGGTCPIKKIPYSNHIELGVRLRF